MSKPLVSRSAAWPAILAFACLPLSGCAHKPVLMPTPNIYTHPEFNPFADVPPALQGNKVEVLYVTDRVPVEPGDKKAREGVHYGTGRSRSAAYGVVDFRIGDSSLSWDELVKASRSAKRGKELEVAVVGARELGRFQPTPAKLIISDAEMAQAQAQAVSQAQAEMEAKFTQELTARLARTPRKDVYLFIHGFNVDFDGSIATTAELWHFLGREGVPVAYSWPAGQGTIRAYEYTNQSAIFTNHHLKQTLRLIAACPAVRKVHIIGHSRGTAVATNAVRELYLEFRATEDVRSTLKIGTNVLAAADMDIDTVITQQAAERVGRAVDGVAVYMFKEDKALAFSNFLSGGLMRLGVMQPTLFDQDEIHTLREARHLQFIDARITKPGSFGHSYFHANPAVSSDLILYLRYGLPPGGAEGRPLKVSDSGFWIIGDDYPGAIEGPLLRALQGAQGRAAARN